MSERVSRVIARFDEATRHLSIVYVLDGEPSGEDREDCELTCAELLAEFPEIKTAGTLCVSAGKHAVDADDLDAIVFVRE